MPVYSWRRRSTKHFGAVWVPYAEVEIQGQDNRFQAFAIQVDSGAVVSLLRRSVAELLQIELESGRKVNLAAIAGGKTLAYVHELQTRFGDGIELSVPFAIAETESVPNLLGRHAVFDRLQVDFDASLQETRITPPWLSSDDARIWRLLAETEQHILGRWSDSPLPGRADEAAGRFIRRGAQVLAAIAGLLKLHRGFACPPLIRSLLEASIQCEYLLQDPEARAEQYLDFEHVTRYEQFQALVKTPEGTVAHLLAHSPHRLSGEPYLKRDYDRVRERFKRNNRRTWDSWYCMTVRNLAETVGRLPEYQCWYKLCSAWAHADPSASRQDWVGDDLPALMTSICYYGRMLLQIAEAKRIVLTGEQYEALRQWDLGVV